MVMIYDKYIFVLFISIIIFIFTYFFFKKIYTTHVLITKGATLSELLIILDTHITIEINHYENDIFDTRDNITNSNFENFYNDLTTSVIKNLPENYFRMMSIYMTDEAVVTIICRKIKSYLVGKVKGV